MKPQSISSEYRICLNAEKLPSPGNCSLPATKNQKREKPLWTDGAWGDSSTRLLRSLGRNDRRGVSS